METNVNEELQKYLECLNEYSFKKFKSQLERTVYEGKGPIPRRRLENTDPVDVANRMCETYTDNDAIIVCISVLEKIGERQLAVDLKAQTNKDLPSTEIPGTSAREFRLAYRDYVIKNFKRMRDCNSRLGEHALLNQRYSELIILDRHRSEEEREHEIMSSGRKQFQILRERTSSSITIESLFKPDEIGEIPDVVVLQGAAGIGKTMTAKKITLDWAHGKLYQGMFDYTFYIHCREMNLHREESSIVEMILKSWADKYWSQEILKNPKRLLFIIDGFDELRYSLDLPEDGLCTDPREKRPVGILLNSLLRRKLLPKSYLIITTRPTAQDQLRRCLNFSRYAEILGFSEEKRKEYFFKFFQEHEVAAQAFGHVKQNETLFTMCFVPVVCWIVCTVMKQQMEKGEDLTRSSKTLTSIYVLYLHMLKSQHNQSKQILNNNLKHLCSLALDGIRKREILFREDEIRKHGLDHEDSLPLFLSESIFQRDIDCECVYSFIHLSFQEFFAALSYILDEENALNSEKHDPDLKTLLKTVTTYRPDFELTVHFLFGLLNQESMKDLGERFGWKISPQIKEFLLEWVKNSKKTVMSGYGQSDKLLFDCLYEMQDEKFAALAMDHVTRIDWILNTKMEDMAVAYCLEFCCSLKELNVDGALHAKQNDEEDSTVDKEKVRRNPQHRLKRSALMDVHYKALAQVLKKTPTLKELCLHTVTLEDTGMKLLCEGLKSSKLEKLQLQKCCLTEACCQDLAKVLRKNLRLAELYLSDLSLDDTGMKQLCEGLQHPECKLQSLWLEGSWLTEAWCQDLAKVLRKNLRLAELYLSDLFLDDTGMKQLCEGLQHPECKLQSLWLQKCRLIDPSCQDPDKVLREKERLAGVYLPDLWFHDPGMKQQFERLQHPKCKLQSLRLEKCCLTEASCQNLAKVLKKNQRPTVLYLSDLYLDYTGMKQLCEGLQHPECKLQSLWLEGSWLTEACCQNLAKVLQKNQSLAELYLSDNFLHDTDMKQLCEGLQHPECKLQSLRLKGSCLTEACCQDLAKVLRKNLRLAELYLSDLYLDDTGMKQLCEGLQHPECKLQSLRLEDCRFKKACCQHLAKALQKNQRLAELYLSHIFLDDTGMKQLCEGLQHPECKLRSLRLDYCCLTDACCQDLAQVLQKNQNLIQLDLSGNGITDTGMKQLCEGLQHPACKLQSLSLDNCGVTRAYFKDFSVAIGKNQSLMNLTVSGIALIDSDTKTLHEALEFSRSRRQSLRLHSGFLTGASCVKLAQALSKNKTLKELDLADSKLKDTGMKLLCQGLNYPDRKLEILRLSNCSFTGACCEEMAQLLSKCQELKELALSCNELGDSGMKLRLCKGQNYPACKLKKLGLIGCSFTGACCEDFAKLLSKIHTLKKLDLSFNATEDTGMKLLCEGLLEHPDSQLESLVLKHCCLTEACCQDLAQVLCKNQRLKECNLSENKLKDTGMKQLCEGLQHPECKLQSLKVQRCCLTEACCPDLAEVLHKNQRLTSLDLSGNELKDTGMLQLCVGLQHPDCKLESLRVQRCCLTEACCPDLAEVLHKNQRLTSLDLSGNELKDTGMLQLCVGLQHPDCKLESLRLDNCGVTRASLEDFSIAIRKNQSLINLTVSGGELRNSDKKTLHEALEFSRSGRQSLSSNAEEHVMLWEANSMDEESYSEDEDYTSYSYSSSP